MSDEKTEEPTQKKIDDSRKKGQVWKSKDFTGVMGFVVGLGTLKAMWPTIQTELEKLFTASFDQLAHPVDLERGAYALLLMAVIKLLMLSLPVVFAVAIVSGLVDFLMVGPLFSQDPLMPKLDKLNPINGLKNMFSKKQFVEAFKNLFKILVTGYVVYGVVRDAMGLVAASVRGDHLSMLAVMGELTTRIAMRVALLLLMFSIFDVWWQRHSYMKELMMSKDEVKREYKESEGDPHHKAKRREMHMEILEGAQMEAVRGADVVVTNPDHVAVALRYERGKDQAPQVVCKGIDSRAEAMKALAKDADVPILRNVPLAHALLRLEVGGEIPEELYDAVAEVLNYVYGLKQQLSSQA